jgi:putative SOS response-associated peptidase YedK
MRSAAAEDIVFALYSPIIHLFSSFVNPPITISSYSGAIMCGRYARKSAQELLAEWFEMDLEQMRWAPTWNAAPQSYQPVVRLSSDGSQREAALLRWELVPSWAKDARIGLNTINARAEDVDTKPAFRAALKKRRCLVPADAFYEWQRTGEKTRRPFAIALQSGEPYAFAGLWESWQPPEGAPLESFTILTTVPNPLMEPIHNRMPVIVAPRDYSRWLDPSVPPPLDLLRPYPAEQMRAWQVSDLVGKVRNNTPSLLDELQDPQQSLFA